MASSLRLVLDKLLYEETGQKIISGIFGFALALMFQRICKDCTIYYAPDINEIKDKIFKLEDTCYKYNAKMIECDENLDILNTYDDNIVIENKLTKQKTISNISLN